MSLIEEILPAYHFREVHQRNIDAPPAAVAAVLRDVDLAASPFVGPLFAIRNLPAMLARGRAAEAAPAALRAGRLGDFFDRAFVTLHDAGDRGLVVGAIGAFWRASGGVQRFAASEFATLHPPGLARLAWAFKFEPLDDGRRCRAVTETRIQCVDDAARRAMRRYWLLIRPASGLIRRETLRLLAGRAGGAPLAAAAASSPAPRAATRPRPGSAS